MWDPCLQLRADSRIWVGTITNSPDFILRPAAESEDRAIRRLVRQARINPTGLDWRRFIVAIHGQDQVVGCGQVKEHASGFRELASLVVSPERRGQGVGGAIVRNLMGRAGPPLWLMCRSGLVPYYLKFDFREVGADEPQPRYFVRMRALAKTLMFAGGRDYLAVMCWNGQGPGGGTPSLDDISRGE